MREREPERKKGNPYCTHEERRIEDGRKAISPNLRRHCVSTFPAQVSILADISILWVSDTDQNLNPEGG